MISPYQLIGVYAMITRAQYMNGEVSHQEYYAQFATPSVISCVSSRIGLDRIKASQDEHFNDIPLKEWDNITPSIKLMVYDKIRAANGSGGVSLSDLVCTAKAAANIIKNA